MIRLRLVLAAAALAALPTAGPCAEEAPSAERGRKALLGRHFTPPSIPLAAYENAWTSRNVGSSFSKKAGPLSGLRLNCMSERTERASLPPW